MKKIFLFAMQATLFLVFGTTECMHRRGAVKMHARKSARRPSDEKGQDVRRERTGNDDAIARALRKSRKGAGGQQLALDDVPAMPMVRDVGYTPSSGCLRLSGNKGLFGIVLLSLIVTAAADPLEDAQRAERAAATQLRDAEAQIAREQLFHAQSQARAMQLERARQLAEHRQRMAEQRRRSEELRRDREERNKRYDACIGGNCFG